MGNYREKPAKIFLDLMRRTVEANKDQKLAVMLTDPTLKYLPGPNATQPIQEGDDPATLPDSVATWFCDVRLTAEDAPIRDVIIPNQARHNIGKAGSPVIVFKDRATGSWQVLSRADRTTETSSIKTYTTLDLDITHVRGYKRDAAGNVLSPFYEENGQPGGIVSNPCGGKNAAGLNRGVVAVNAAGQPINSFIAGTTLRQVPFLQLDWGTDQFGMLFEDTNNPDGTVTTVKRTP